MANLKDLIVNGIARIVGKVYSSGGFVGNLTGNVTGNVSGSSGSCTGNSATATKATQDGSGNTITSYYEPKANVTSKGSATQPVYFNSSGVATACTYTLGKSVPSDAVFTDTNTKVTSVSNHYVPSGGGGN